MTECAILYAHHRNDEVTVAHFDLLRRVNPWPVVPVRFEGNTGIDPAFVTRAVEADQWSSNDRLLYAWFSARHFDADRYVYIEYDAYCPQPLKEYYGGVWDAPAVVAHVEVPGAGNWQWFHRAETARLPEALRPFTRGVWPVNGVLLSHVALAEITRLFRSHAPDGVFSELRLGTLIRASGHDPLAHPEGYNSWTPLDVPADRNLQTLYHPVK